MRSTEEQQMMGDPLKVASNVAGLLLENDRVRVITGTLKPGDKAAMHSHPDHVVYTTKSGKIKLTYPSGNTKDIDMEEGRAMFMEAQSHEVNNIGDTTVAFVVIELK